MHLPFTEPQFLDVFAAYNRAVWPVVVALWIWTAMVTALFVTGRVSSVPLSWLAAVHWAWSGIVYHAIFFTRINPAAWVFAALFCVQAVAFIWWGVVRRRLTFEWRSSGWHIAAATCGIYALAYPLLVVLSGRQFPAAPAFAVPCPTLLWTAALLLTAAKPFPRVVLAVPVLWAAVGGSAAWLLGMTPDLMLVAAGGLLVALGRRTANLNPEREPRT